MKSAKFNQLSDQAAQVGARINRTGDSAFIILYRGRRHLVVNLRAAEVVLRQIGEHSARARHVVSYAGWQAGSAT